MPGSVDGEIGSPPPKVVYLVPAHDEERVLASSVTRIVGALRSRHLRGEVVVVENGSRDHTRAIASGLEGDHDGVRVRLLVEPSAGLGLAYARGIRELAPGDAERTTIVLAAADLPFDFSDLDAFLALRASRPLHARDIVLGSKAHPRSRIVRSPLRKLASAMYRVWRRSVLHMNVGDSQGSMFLDAATAHALSRRTCARDYFFTTELLFHAVRGGCSLHEIPVTHEGDIRPSHVRLVADAWSMVRQSFELRERAATTPAHAVPAGRGGALDGATYDL